VFVTSWDTVLLVKLALLVVLLVWGSRIPGFWARRLFVSPPRTQKPDPDEPSNWREIFSMLGATLVALLLVIPILRHAPAFGLEPLGAFLVWIFGVELVLTFLRPNWYNIPMRGEYFYGDALTAGSGNHVLYRGVAAVFTCIGVWRLIAAPIATRRCQLAIANAPSPSVRIHVPTADADTMIVFPAGLALVGETCSSLLLP